MNSIEFYSKRFETELNGPLQFGDEDECTNPQGDLISREALKEAIRQRLCISSLKYLTEQEKVIVEEIDNATGHNWKFYYDHGYKQAKRDLKRTQGESSDVGLIAAYHSVCNGYEPIKKEGEE